MPGIGITLCAETLAKEIQIEKELRSALAGLMDVTMSYFNGKGFIDSIVLLDEEMPGIEEFISQFDRKKKWVVLLTRVPLASSNEVLLPQLWSQGKVDDVFVAPFRTLELLSKLRLFSQVLMWTEVVKANTSMAETLGTLGEELNVLSRIQKSKLPKRYFHIKNFHVLSRYLAGEKSGGDYFDLFESEDQRQLTLFLSHSTSYGLSSAVLSVLIKVTLALGQEAVSAPGGLNATLGQIYQELLLTLGEKDQLSLFYGVILSEERLLRFINLGSSQAFLANHGKGFQALGILREPMSQSVPFSPQDEVQVPFPRGSRLLVLSRGFVESVGGTDKVIDLLSAFIEKDPRDLLNELVYQVKSRLKSKDDLPLQDCSVLYFDSTVQVAKINRFLTSDE